MAVFFNRGERCFDRELIEKIKKDAEPCWWHEGHDKEKNYQENVDYYFTGYIDEQGQCFDICGILRRKGNREELKKSKLRHEQFMKLYQAVIKSTDEIEKFTSQLETISNTKTKIRNIATKIRKGYVSDTQKIGGSKRKRRFKKDNRRFLTEKEIENLKKELESYRQYERELSKKIKFEEVLYNVIYRMYDITVHTIGKYHQKYGYHDTEGIYLIFEKRLQALKDKINGITFSDMVELEKKKRKDIKLQKKGKNSASSVTSEAEDSDSEAEEETKISIKDIKVFEETYQKVKEKVEEDKEAEEMMTVRRERQVTNRARHYIDESGNRVELGSEVRQVVLHN